jgi:hypothetical protein
MGHSRRNFTRGNRLSSVHDNVTSTRAEPTINYRQQSKLRNSEVLSMKEAGTINNCMIMANNSQIAGRVPGQYVTYISTKVQIRLCCVETRGLLQGTVDSCFTGRLLHNHQGTNSRGQSCTPEFMDSRRKPHCKTLLPTTLQNKQ